MTLAGTGTVRRSQRPEADERIIYKVSTAFAAVPIARSAARTSGRGERGQRAAHHRTLSSFTIKLLDSNGNRSSDRAAAPIE